jgi:hypothetical protein
MLSLPHGLRCRQSRSASGGASSAGWAIGHLHQATPKHLMRNVSVGRRKVRGGKSNNLPELSNWKGGTRRSFCEPAISKPNSAGYIGCRGFSLFATIGRLDSRDLAAMTSNDALRRLEGPLK